MEHGVRQRRELGWLRQLVLWHLACCFAALRRRMHKKIPKVWFQHSWPWMQFFRRNFPPKKPPIVRNQAMMTALHYSAGTRPAIVFVPAM